MRNWAGPRGVTWNCLHNSTSSGRQVTHASLFSLPYRHVALSGVQEYQNVFGEVSGQVPPAGHEVSPRPPEWVPLLVRGAPVCPDMGLRLAASFGAQPPSASASATTTSLSTSRLLPGAQCHCL